MSPSRVFLASGAISVAAAVVTLWAVAGATWGRVVAAAVLAVGLVAGAWPHAASRTTPWAFRGSALVFAAGALVPIALLPDSAYWADEAVSALIYAWLLMSILAVMPPRPNRWCSSPWGFIASSIVLTAMYLAACALG
jgi:peptidoglycan/LPS O-acetylase OafA/YrhL